MAASFLLSSSVVPASCNASFRQPTNLMLGSLKSSFSRLSLTPSNRTRLSYGLQTTHRDAPRPLTFTVRALKQYKLKTNKAAAKRFRVTGTGKIIRRRAGKQHLLVKKTKTRKKRLSKMVSISFCKLTAGENKYQGSSASFTSASDVALTVQN